MPIQIPLEQLISRIEIDNDWWHTGKVNAYYTRMTPRPYIELFSPLVFQNAVKRAVVLMGQRRIGKSVMIYHTIQRLLDSGVPPKDICYISIETPVYHKVWLEELMDVVKLHQNREDFNGMYFFFDEIQYLKDWEIHLKSLVDTFHYTKFIVSGSAAAALKLKSRESGAGRFTDFILPPLTFYEFLSLKGLNDLVQPNPEGDLQPMYSSNNIEELNLQFIEYINYGGYPEVTISKDLQDDKERYIKSDIIEKVLQRDLPSLYGIEDTQELNSLFTSIAYGSGDEISIEALSMKSQVSKHTLTRYLEYLEAAFLIRIVHRVDEKASRFKRAYNFKAYLTNPSLRTALFSAVSTGEIALGKMIETAIFSQWEHSSLKRNLYYARWNKGEIDMVNLNRLNQPEWAAELKTSNSAYTNPKELNKYMSFCATNKIKELIISTKNVFEVVNVDGISVYYIPSAIYCYMIGRNLIERKVKSPDRQI